MKYAFVAQHKKTWPVDLMCRQLGVTRNGYYGHRQRRMDPAHQNRMDCVKKIAKASGYTYGTRRIKRAMEGPGYRISRQKARKLMREAGVIVRYRRKYKVTTNSNHPQPVYENVLNRQFSTRSPDQAWVSDITSLWTQEGWLYLTVVIDLFSRRVVGWSMSSRMKATLVTDALRMAIWLRRPRPGLIVHSDRGSQYASQACRRLLKAHGLVGSMSRKGNCWDNSVAESFFASLKKERVHWNSYPTRSQAQQDVLNYITMYYNHCRLHSSLGYRSPDDYEAVMAELKKVA